MGNISHMIFVFSISLLALVSTETYSFPLSTNGKWIIDSTTGQRVKLQCVNWPGHMGVMLAEGLDKKPIKYILSEISKQGLNCVRLTYATHMFTRFSNQTIEQALNKLGLSGAKTGIIRNNPNLLNMTHPQAYSFVVDKLGANNIMVISDNHISEPKWCCSPTDGNAFFGDTAFDPKEWLQGLSLAAQLLKGKPQVVAMSLRNELRGPLQNLDSWYTNVTKGALTVHQVNPNVLVVVSGFFNDNDLGFLRGKPLNISLNGKLAFEVHTYIFSGEKKDWSKNSANWLCDKVTRELDNKAGFLTGGPNPAPLVVSEFGIDLITRSEPDTRWLTCVVSYLASNDLDWAWWALQGNYYIRAGRVNAGESFGILNFQWDRLSYPEFPQRFQLLLKKLQEPSSKLPMSNILYHPQTGLCVQVKENQVVTSDCLDTSLWTMDGDLIKLEGENPTRCLKATGEGLPVTISNDCSTKQSSWKPLSRTGLHLGVVNPQTNPKGGQTLCLEKENNSSLIVTKRCICVEDDPGCLANPQGQWFKLVPTNVK